MKKHTTMSLPKSLYESAKEIINSLPELGYATPTEFCKDAIREKISSIKKEQKELRKSDADHIIAEIKKAMDKHSEDYKSVFDSAGCAIAVFSSPDGKLVMFNQGFLEISGFSEDELRDKRFHDFIVPEDLPRVENNFRARIKGKNVENNYVVKAIDGNGEIIPIEINSNLHKVGDNIEGVIVCIKKIYEK